MQMLYEYLIIKRCLLLYLIYSSKYLQLVQYLSRPLSFSDGMHLLGKIPVGIPAQSSSPFSNIVSSVFSSLTMNMVIVFNFTVSASQ